MSAGGLEIFGAVGVSLQLVKAAGTCLSIVNEIRQISNLALEQNNAHFELQVQALKFERWCATLSIQDILRRNEQGPSNSGLCKPTDQIQLKGAVESQLRLENPILVDLTTRALTDMKNDFAEATKIIMQYAGVSPPPEKISSTTSLQVPKSGKQSRWDKMLRKEPKTQPSASLQAHSNVISRGGSSMALRTKWVTSDKGRVEVLLKRIGHTNELLVVLLDTAHQAQVDRQTDMTILDLMDHDTLEGTTSRPELKTMARIKQWQMQERRDSQTDDAVSAYSFSTISGANQASRRIHSYQIRDFKRGSLPHGEYRTLTVLEDKPVMVEWKYYNRDQPFRLEQTLRLGGLVGLLNRDELFKKFMTLPCKGLVDDADNSRIGVVFAVEGSAGNRLKSLQALIRETQVPVPIGQRFQLAKGLVTAVHHLHSVDWLHKSIRSDNIICSWAPESEIQVSPSSPRGKPAVVQENGGDGAGSGFGSAKTSAARPRLRPLPPQYLVGWDLSRPDHPLELSETLSISTAGFQSRRDEILLYNHPSLHAQSASGKRPRYCARFDIYSLGLVLLEIGLWRTLSELRRHCNSDAEFRDKLPTEFCDKLLPRVGEVYWRAVQRCINGDFDDGSDGASETDGFQLQIAFERLVVSEIERCYA
ncbi:hypothetical protein QIS74_08183 [Colletotrichum tabaci]|uniref:Prion-inhibition and propagation HeLo domain-containing protein n=1 Tax=Colletotrichum tabaci TaxID=1209068 RepID=A0AAV9T739_9PEZI